MKLYTRNEMLIYTLLFIMLSVFVVNYFFKNDIDLIRSKYRYSRDRKEFVLHFDENRDEVFKFFSNEIEFKRASEVIFSGSLIGLKAMVSFELKDSGFIAQSFREYYSDESMIELLSIRPFQEDSRKLDLGYYIENYNSIPADYFMEVDTWELFIMIDNQHSFTSQFLDKSGFDQGDYLLLKERMNQLNLWCIRNNDNVFSAKFRGNLFEGFEYVYEKPDIELENECIEVVFSNEYLQGRFVDISNDCSNMFTCGYNSYYSR